MFRFLVIMSDPSTTTALPSSLRMTVWEGSTDTKNKKNPTTNGYGDGANGGN